jgi:hypothetical protein
MKKYINILLIAILLLTTSIISSVSYAQNTIDFSNLQEVYPNLNDFNKDRVNIVFYFDDKTSLEQARKVVDGYLRYNGPITEVYNANTNSRVLKTGLFQTYPFTESRNKFNFLISFNKPESEYSKVEIDKKNFKNFIPVVNRSVTNAPGGSGGIDFGSYVTFDTATSAPEFISLKHYNGVYSEEYGNVFTHELSHFMFNFEDEYRNQYGYTISGPNNCAENLETAQSLWGNTVGKLSKSYLYSKELFKDYYLVNQNKEQIPQFGYVTSEAEGNLIKAFCNNINNEYYITSRTNIMNTVNVPFYSPYQESIAESVMTKYSGNIINTPVDPKPVEPKPIDPKPSTTTLVTSPVTTPVRTITEVQTPTSKPVVQTVQPVQPKKETTTVRTGAPYDIGIALSLIVILFTSCIVILKRKK